MDFAEYIKQERLEEFPPAWIADVKGEFVFENENYQIKTEDLSIDYKDLIKEAKRLCIVCNKVFSNSYSYLVHNIDHLTIPLDKLNIEVPLQQNDSQKQQLHYSCDHCGIKIKSKENLRRHIKNKHQDNNLVSCQYCSIKVKKHYLLTHCRKVHAPNKVQCKLCLKKFMCVEYLKKHTEFIHYKKSKQPTKNKVECDICKAKLRSFAVLKNHYRWVHSDNGQKHICKVCGKRYRTQYHLQTHLKNHKEED